MQVQRPPLEAWYMNDSEEDQRLPHHRNPPEYVTLEKLAGSGCFCNGFVRRVHIYMASLLAFL